MGAMYWDGICCTEQGNVQEVRGREERKEERGSCTVEADSCGALVVKNGPGSDLSYISQRVQVRACRDSR